MEAGTGPGLGVMGLGIGECWVSGEGALIDGDGLGMGDWGVEWRGELEAGPKGEVCGSETWDGPTPRACCRFCCFVRYSWRGNGIEWRREFVSGLNNDVEQSFDSIHKPG
jgi:hypothetical protein